LEKMGESNKMKRLESWIHCKVGGR
jgi:hypothetical protein